MAIAPLGTDAQNTEQALDNSIQVSHTLASGSARVVVIKFMAWKNTAGAPTVSSVTYGGASCSLITASTIGQYLLAAYIVKESSLPANGANNAVITFTGNVDEKAMTVQAYSGVDQTTTVRDTDGDAAFAGGATHPTLALTTVSGDRVDTALGQYANTPSSDDTADISAVGTADAVDCYTSHRNATGTSTTVGWTATGTDWLILAFSLIPASASPDVTLQPNGFDLNTALGTPTPSLVLQPSGFTLSFAQGTPTIPSSADKLVQPTGLTLTTALGTFDVQNDITMQPGGGSISMALGTPQVTGTTDNNVLFIPDGLSMTMTLGQIPRLVLPTGFSIGLSLGTPTLQKSQTITPSGFVISANIGSPSILGAISALPNIPLKKGWITRRRGRNG